MAIDLNAARTGNSLTYIAEGGDTFATIALRFYDASSAAEPLALSNGKLVTDPLIAGDTVVLGARLLGFASLASAIANLLVFELIAIEVEIAASCFAPGVELWEDGDSTKVSEGDMCELSYEVVDPGAKLTRAQLEVVRKEEPGTVLAKIDLDAGQFTEGAHDFEWDGLCTEGAMADTYVHAVHSPYLVRVVGFATSRRVAGHAEAVIRIKDILVERPPDCVEEELEQFSDASYQQLLIHYGFHCGPVDNAPGKKTKRAVKLFQHEHRGLRQTGRLDKYTKAYLDETAPTGTGLDHYQFILNYIGYGCGSIDGLIGRKTRHAVERYRADSGLGPGNVLDPITKTALDAEALSPLTRYEVLEDDTKVTEVYENALPVPGKEKKIFVECSSTLCPGSLPYNKKYKKEKRTLVRAHLPILVRPLLETSAGKSVFAADATGPLRINFAVDIVAPPANFGVPNATAQTYVQTAMGLDGNEAVSGHHAHKNRGGVRTDTEPGVFARGKSLKPYEVTRDGALHYSRCVTLEDEPARGTAGVYFQPSTIAGDRFALVVSVDSDDLDTPLATPIEKKTGTMIIWRRYRVAKRWLMGYVPRPHPTESAAHLGLPTWYDPAFIDFVVPALPTKQVIVPRNADVEMIDLPLYTALLRTAGYRASQLSNAQITSRYGQMILFPLQTASVYNAANEQGYYDSIDAEITAFEDRFASTLREQSYLEASPGLVVLVFDENAPMAGTSGINAITNANLQGWAWSLLASKAVLHLIHDQDTASGIAINGETLAHEFGHGLWLHHASTTAGSNPWVDDMPEHNAAEYQSCTMSYVALANFCGKCVLKLRGFDEQKV